MKSLSRLSLLVLCTALLPITMLAEKRYYVTDRTNISTVYCVEFDNNKVKVTNAQIGLVANKGIDCFDICNKTTYERNEEASKGCFAYRNRTCTGTWYETVYVSVLVPSFGPVPPMPMSMPQQVWHSNYHDMFCSFSYSYSTMTTWNVYTNDMFNQNNKTTQFTEISRSDLLAAADKYKEEQAKKAATTTSSPVFGCAYSSSVPVYTPVNTVGGGYESNAYDYDNSYSSSSNGNTKHEPRLCLSCGGSGKCSQCHGSTFRTDNLYGTGTDYSHKCGICGGSGVCNRCGGAGRK